MSAPQAVRKVPSQADPVPVPPAHPHLLDPLVAALARAVDRSAPAQPMDHDTGPAD